MIQQQELSYYGFDQFREHVAAGVAHCSDHQLRHLADQLNASVIARRNSKHAGIVVGVSRWAANG